MSRRCGRGGKIHSFWAMYSFRMSVCSVPSSVDQGTPCFSAAARKKANRIVAGPLIVIDVVMSPRGISSNSASKSCNESVATPHRPTSPSERGSSESRPMSVGMSNATDRPPWPCFSRKWYRAFVSSGVPKPANCRIVHSRPRYIEWYTPRVNG